MTWTWSWNIYLAGVELDSDAKAFAVDTLYIIVVNSTRTRQVGYCREHTEEFSEETVTEISKCATRHRTRNTHSYTVKLCLSIYMHLLCVLPLSIEKQPGCKACEPSHPQQVKTSRLPVSWFMLKDTDVNVHAEAYLYTVLPFWILLDGSFYPTCTVCQRDRAHWNSTRYCILYKYLLCQDESSAAMHLWTPSTRPRACSPLTYLPSRLPHLTKPLHPFLCGEDALSCLLAFKRRAWREWPLCFSPINQRALRAPQPLSPLRRRRLQDSGSDSENRET